MTTALKLNCPLPPQDLLFKALAAKAGLSVLEEIELDLLSEKPDLSAEKLLGQPMGVELKRADGSKRHFNGICMRFGIAAPQGRHYGYRASVRPWLWYLTRTADCRIFQELSVPEIVEQVFADHGAIANFQFKLDRSYRKRVYCVQYRETDFNFVARLLEDEGIYWYFEHSEGQHKLVLVDDPSFHEPAPGCEKLPFYGNADQVPPGKEYVGQWSFSREVQTGRVALTSYDFERPSTSLGTDGAHPREHSLADYEQFDFQGEYTVKSDASNWPTIAPRNWPRATSGSRAAPTPRPLPRDMSLNSRATGARTRTPSTWSPTPATRPAWPATSRVKAQVSTLAAFPPFQLPRSFVRSGARPNPLCRGHRRPWS